MQAALPLRLAPHLLSAEKSEPKAGVPGRLHPLQTRGHRHPHRLRILEKGRWSQGVSSEPGLAPQEGTYLTETSAGA